MIKASIIVSYLSPRVSVVRLIEADGSAPQRDHLQVFPAELGGHGELLPALPASRALAPHRDHGRVVRYLATPREYYSYRCNASWVFVEVAPIPKGR